MRPHSYYTNHYGGRHVYRVGGRGHDGYGYLYPYTYHHVDYSPYYYPYWSTGFFFGVHLGYASSAHYVTVVDPYPVYTTYYAPAAVVERRVYVQETPVEVVDAEQAEPADYAHRTEGGYVYQPPAAVAVEAEDADVEPLEPAEEASAGMEEPLDDSPSDAQLRDLAEEFSRGLIAGQEAFRAGDYADARSRFAGALAVMPDNIEAKLSYAQSCFALGDYSVAAAAVRDAALAWPDLPDARIDLTKPYGQGDDFKKQLRSLALYVLQSPDDPDARLLLGYQHYFSGRKSGALVEFRAVLKLRPENKAAAMFVDARRPK